MSDNALRKIVYGEMIPRVETLYGVTAKREHDFIYEFSEGPLPIFKLILVHNDEGPGFIMVSYHIEVEAAIAIQWFFRLREIEPNLRVGPCYLHDSDGTPHVGEDAQILRLYMIEQDIISNFMQGNREPEEIVNSTTKPPPSPLKTYATYKAAITSFNKLEKKDGDIEH